MDRGEPDVAAAEQRMAVLRQAGYAVRARYDRRAGRIVLALSTGVQIAFPVHLAAVLAGAAAEDLGVIEISGSGLGLHWPRLDADLYVPALMQGIFGPRARMAAALGAAGGRTSSAAKVAAARANGRKGGRPKGSGPPLSAGS